MNCWPKSLRSPCYPLSDLLPIHSVPEEIKQSTTLNAGEPRKQFAYSYLTDIFWFQSSKYFAFLFFPILPWSQVMLEVSYCPENLFPLWYTAEGHCLFFQLKDALHFICTHVISAFTLITPSISSLSVRYQNRPWHQQHSIPPQEWHLPLDFLHQMKLKHLKLRMEEVTNSTSFTKDPSILIRCLLARRLSADIFTFSCLSSTQSL